MVLKRFYLKILLFIFLGNEEKANYMISSNDERRLSSKTHPNDDPDAVIDSFSQINEKNPIDESWQEDTATVRAERLQSNEVSDDVERQKRRNDALFLGKFFFFKKDQIFKTNFFLD